MKGIKLKRVFIGLAFVVGAGIVGLIVWARSSTAPLTLGPNKGTLAECPSSPNCVSSYATDPQHRIEPLRFDGDASHAMETLVGAIQGMPRSQIMTSSESDGYLHAEFRSAFIGYIDDVEFLVDPEASLIHVRSASRLGHSDMGVNRNRVESIRVLFAQVGSDRDSAR